MCQGGGVHVSSGGEATLININVYANLADDEVRSIYSQSEGKVRSDPSERSLNFQPAPAGRFHVPSERSLNFQPAPAGRFHVLAFLLQGGGIAVDLGGVAYLDGCQVYENFASRVRLHYEPSQTFPPAGTLRVLMVGRVAGDSTSMAWQC